jgi:putative oxidoreductase
MPLSFETSDALQNVGMLVGRLLMCVIYVWSGFQKLRSPKTTIAYFETLHIPLPQLVWGVTVVVELLGGLALMIGFEARLVALVLCLWSVATAVTGHSNFADRDMEIHFMKNMSMAGGFLFIALFGVGKYALQ